MINQAVLVGRLAQDVDLRYTPNGVAVANFTVTVSEVYKKDGQRQEDTDFIDCVVWRQDAENLAKFKKKGEMVGVVGKLKKRSYEGTDGKRVYVTEIKVDSVQYLPNGGSGNQSSGSGSGNQQPSGGSYNNNQQRQPQQNRTPENTRPIDISDDDLPF